MRAAFENHVCIVTGGASGLGKELCGQLNAFGAIVIVADIDELKARAVATELNMASGRVYSIEVNVADSGSVQNLIDGVCGKFGRIDYMFNNAGVAVWGEVRDLTLEEWRRVIDVNLAGVINGVHYCYPRMIQQGFGHIINTASSFGLIPYPLCAPYVASKFAIVGLTNALRIEARGFGINVTVVCPGFVSTEMTEGVRGLLQIQMMDVRYAATHILSRVARGKKIIVFPAYVRMFEFMFRLFPWLFERITSRHVSGFRNLCRTEGREGKTDS